MKQNVLIVHNDYQLAGGEGNVADSEARMLLSHGHAVTLYRRDNAEIASYGVFMKLLLAFATVFSWRTYREIRALIRQNHIDVVHVHNTVPLVSPSVYYAAWAEHVPVVQTVHNYRFLCPNGIFYRDGRVCEDCLGHGGLCNAVRHACYRHSRAQSFVLAFTLWLHRLLGTYRRIEAYICLTEFGRKKLCERLPASRLYVKPNPVQVDCKLVPYSERDDAYVFLGRLDTEKGVWVLLEAFKRLPKHSLVIVGSGPEEAGMRAFVAEKGMQNVTLTGQLPHGDAIMRVARARALVMPTQLYEGLPLTVLEAFSLGTPVFGSALGNVGEVIHTHGGGFTFDQTDPDALARCIEGCQDEALAEASEKALAASKEAYSPEKNYETLLQIYDSAAMRRGGEK